MDHTNTVIIKLQLLYLYILILCIVLAQHITRAVYYINGIIQWYTSTDYIIILLYFYTIMYNIMYYPALTACIGNDIE